MSGGKLFLGLLAATTVGLIAILPITPLGGIVDRREIVLSIGLASIIFAVEIAVSGWSGSSLRKLVQPDASQRTDWIMFAIHITGTMSLLAFLFSFGGVRVLGKLGQLITFYGANFRIDTGFIALNFALYFLLASFVDYWLHRFFHTGPLWHLHKIHHAATSANPLVTHRAHPANIALYPLVSVMPSALIASSPAMIFAVATLTMLIQLTVHSALPYSFGWIGRWVVVSPAAHRIHHSANPEHYGTNFATTLIIWDQLFGTWYEGSAPVDRLGIPDEKRPHGLMAQFVHDLAWFLVATARLARWRRAEPTYTASIPK